MTNFYDDLSYHYERISGRERRMDKKRSKINNLFRNPCTLMNFELELPGGHKERYADNTTQKYIDVNYNGFKTFKKD